MRAERKRTKSNGIALFHWSSLVSGSICPETENLVVEPPLDGHATHGQIGEVTEQGARHVNGIRAAARALVHHLTGRGLAVVGDSDGLATVPLVHDCRGQSDHVLGQTIVSSVTVAGVGHGRGSVVVGSVTRARRALGARTAGAGAGARARAGGAGRGGSTGGRRGGRLRSGSGSRSGRGLGSSSGGRLRSRRGSHNRNTNLSGARRAGGAGAARGLLRRRRRNNRSSRGDNDNRAGGGGRGSSRGRLAGIQSDGGVDSGPDNVSDGLPDENALVQRGSRAEGGKGRSQSESLGQRGHCER